MKENDLIYRAVYKKGLLTGMIHKTENRTVYVIDGTPTNKIFASVYEARIYLQNRGFTLEKEWIK